MFRFHKPTNYITLFHRSSSPASSRVLTILKQASASAVSGATEDQASNHAKQSENQQQYPEFELEITEKPPTSDQLRSIFEYLGAGKTDGIVKGASKVEDALSVLKTSASAFQRPLVVDWNNGRAIAGDNESQILSMLKDLPKDGSS